MKSAKAISNNPAIFRSAIEAPIKGLRFNYYQHHQMLDQA
jgi:hypothetical protein